MDGAAAPPEGGRHLRAAHAARRQARYLADTPRFIGYIRSTAGRYRELVPLLRLIDAIEGTEAVAGYAFGRV